MQIRRLTVEDAFIAAKLDKACFSTPWSEAAYAETLSNPGSVFLGGFLEPEDLTGDGTAESMPGTLIAACGGVNVLDETDISNVAVLEPFRGRGFSRRMMEELLSQEKQLGIKIFLLEVRASNAVAISLYESLGFREVGRRKAFYEEPKEDAILMRMDLE